MAATPAQQLALGPFLLEERLGKGAVGEVWRGRHRKRGISVAVKVVAADVDEHEGAALSHEARAVAALDHPGIVRVLDLGRVDAEAARGSGGLLPEDRPYLVMELYEGGTLHPEVGRIGWARLRAMLLQVLDALAHAHGHGQIHRDLKPGNVLLDRTGQRAVLTDFGLAALLEAANQDDALVRGTPAYMAPEQLLAHWRDQGPWTDLYSLGCLAWTMATGQPPFGREVQEAIRGHAQLSPPDFVPVAATPPALEGWLRHLLRKQPRDRFQHAADAARALARLPDRAGGGPRRRVRSGATPEVTCVLEPVVVQALESTGEGAEDTAGLPVPASWRRPDEWLRADLALLGTRGLVGIRSLRMVDREDERDALWSSLQAAAHQVRPQVVILRGPMGLGKSRLARWVGERAHELGCAQVLSAIHAPEGGLESGMGGAVARSVHGLGLDQAALLERLRDELAPALSDQDLAALAELAVPGHGPPSATLLHPRWRHALLLRWLAVLARRRRVVLWLDDVQWSEESIDLARKLLQDAQRLPVLVVATAQDEALAEQPRAHGAMVRLAEAGATQLGLGPLDDRHQHALVQQLLGLAPALAGAVVRRTAGNPLFAEQLVRHWVEQDLLEPSEEGLVTRTGAHLDLPPDLVTVWGERLGRLLDHRPTGEGHSLELAAVLGQGFGRELWTAACQAAGLEPAMGRVELMLAERLLVTDIDGPDRFLFAHGMVREALLLRAREGRRVGRWHAAAATALEAAAAQGEAGVELRDRSARHLFQAGALEAALEPLHGAAWARAQAGRDDTAAELMDLRRRALDGLHLPRTDKRWGEQLVVEGWLASIANRYDRAERLAQEALDSGFEHSWARTIAGAHRVLGITLRGQGRSREAVRHLRASVRLWKRLRKPLEAARAQQNLGDARADLGALDEAWQSYAAAIVVHREHGDHSGEAHCHLGHALVARQRGELELGIEHLSLARRCFGRCGNRWGEAVCINDIADIHRVQGDLDAAEAGFREARDRYLALGYRPTVPDINRGLVLAERGRHEEAVALLEPLAAAIAATERGSWLTHVQAGLLRSHVALGNRERAEALLEILERDLAEQALVDEELAALVEGGASFAALRDWLDFAAWASRLAAAHWRGLGREEDALRAEATAPSGG